MKAQCQSPISPSYGVSICLRQRGGEHLGVGGSKLFHLLSSSVCRWTCGHGPCNNVNQQRLLFDCWEDEFLG